MSKGLEHIQRAIVELIAAEPDGARQTSAICSRVYGVVSKSKRVAVSRALRTMKLPGTWTVEGSHRRSGEAWLYDPRNRESMLSRDAVEGDDKKFERRRNPAEARRYRGATPALKSPI